MNEDPEFRFSQDEKRRTICVDVAGGTVRLELTPDIPRDRGEEITRALNLAVGSVTFERGSSMQPDVERLNSEQPVSVAVQHP
jgi:hypothetical protein